MASVELELVSSVELLRVAFVELELERVLQEEDGGRGGRGPGRGARRARRSSTTSFLAPVDGGRRELEPKTRIWISKIKAKFETF